MCDTRVNWVGGHCVLLCPTVYCWISVLYGMMGKVKEGSALIPTGDKRLSADLNLSSLGR